MSFNDIYALDFLKIKLWSILISTNWTSLLFIQPIRYTIFVKYMMTIKLSKVV